MSLDPYNLTAENIAAGISYGVRPDGTRYLRQQGIIHTPVRDSISQGLSLALGIKGYGFVVRLLTNTPSTPNPQTPATQVAPHVNVNGLPVNSKITGWTRHGTEQALGRDGGIGVSNRAITNAVNNPVQSPIAQSGGRIKYIGRDATVVLNQDGRVVTTWSHGRAGVR